MADVSQNRSNARLRRIVAALKYLEVEIMDGLAYQHNLKHTAYPAALRCRAETLPGLRK